MNLSAPTSLLSNLTDGLARGRICIGEIAGISPEELDALFELGAQRLDTDRNHEAVKVFSGLVALYPYSAKHWRAYGIALHRVMRLSAALAAYEASLLIEPGRIETQCYQGEVLLYLNRLSEAEGILSPIAECGRQDLEVRAKTLLQFLEQAQASNEPISIPIPAPQVEKPSTSSIPEQPPTQEYDAPLVVSESPTTQDVIDEFAPPVPASGEEPYFELEDGRPLPLSPSTFERIRSEESPSDSPDSFESTLTSLTYRPAIDGPQLETREVTQTAIVPRRQLRLNEEARNEGTAIIPGRPAHRAQEAAEKKEESESSTDHEVTQTAVVRRRRHLPLCDEHTQIMPGRFFEDDTGEET